MDQETSDDAFSLALSLMQRALDVLDGGTEYLEVKARLQSAIDALIAAGI